MPALAANLVELLLCLVELPHLLSNLLLNFQLGTEALGGREGGREGGGGEGGREGGREGGGRGREGGREGGRGTRHDCTLELLLLLPLNRHHSIEMCRCHGESVRQQSHLHHCALDLWTHARRLFLVLSL